MNPESAATVARLNAAVASTGKTVAAFARQAGMAPESLAVILAGERRAGSVDYALIAEASKVSVSQLLGAHPESFSIRVRRHFRFLPRRVRRFARALPYRTGLVTSRCGLTRAARIRRAQRYTPVTRAQLAAAAGVDVSRLNALINDGARPTASEHDRVIAASKRLGYGLPPLLARLREEYP